MPKTFLAIILSPCSIIPKTSLAFKPDLISGCRAIAEERKNTTEVDSVHAAHCLGALDGIMTSTLKRQNPVPLPDPFFNKRSITPSEIARQVVSVLRARPEIIELARRRAANRGTMAIYLALAVSYQCNTSASGSK